MVGMDGPGSSLNYKEPERLRSASLREWAHVVVTEFFNDQPCTPAEMG